MQKGQIQLDLTGTGYCAAFNFRRTARAVTRMYDAAMQKSGIRSTQFAILVGIAKNQPIAIVALGDILVIDTSTLTRSLHLLRKQGLITVSERSTRRQRFLGLTPKGESTLARALPYWRKMQCEFQTAVGPNYWSNLRSELERLAKLAVSLGLQTGDAA
jgi:DNA-binding MarR family transcriptional regulator